MGEIEEYFESFLTKKPLFKDKKLLQSDFVPNEIEHREEQVKSIAEILAPSLRLEKPSNLFVYGTPGTGKTLTIKHTINKIKNIAHTKNIPILSIYVNCKLKKVADTEYRLVAEFIRKLGEEVPSTGLPTEEVYKIFFNIIDSKKQLILLVLDEIDQLVDKVGDEVLYSLTRINSDLKNCQMSFIGISNDLTFVNTLDPRIKSSLSEEELVFPPYNAIQLSDILKKRSCLAFSEGSIGDGVVERCAALAAREHGDVRRALELLRVAGEIAERQGLVKLDLDCLERAEKKIEKDRILDSIEFQPKQFHSVLYSIFRISEKENKNLIHTGEVYDIYKDLCGKINLRPLTQRRVSDIIGELDMLGIINAKTISKGRYGRTRDISLSIPEAMKIKIDEILKAKLNFV